jgi:hypothetical protein
MLREASSASITCLTAHSCRAFGLPRTLGRRETVERLVIGGMYRDELALQMGGQFGDQCRFPPQYP